LLSFYTWDCNSTHSLTISILEPNLGILLKAKVVLLASLENAKGNLAPVYLSFSLNYNFKNKKIKVNINIIQIKSEQKHETDDTHKTIEEDRKLLLHLPCGSSHKAKDG
jgi:cullin 1